MILYIVESASMAKMAIFFYWVFTSIREFGEGSKEIDFLIQIEIEIEIWLK